MHDLKHKLIFNSTIVVCNQFLGHYGYFKEQLHSSFFSFIDCYIFCSTVINLGNMFNQALSF